jgi:hypothetical protein
MKEWVLIIELLSPGGDFMDKIPVTMPTKTSCTQALKELPKKSDDPLGVQFKGICVTMDHWTGRKKDKGVAFD